jgi:hypothetical protein
VLQLIPCLILAYPPARCLRAVLIWCIRQVVAGSTPPQHERAEYDTVAYCGVIPVKVRRKKPVANAACECDLLTHGPAVGNLLVPSGLNDGAAVSWPRDQFRDLAISSVIARVP